MLGRKLKNSGMTLVEVLVSMFVLSIAAVTVITAFSMAAQVNTKAKRQQGAEALMENMLEYAEAGGTDFQTWFGVDSSDYHDLTEAVPPVTPAPGATPTPKIEQMDKVKSGYQEYTVKITTDASPTGYVSDQMNELKVIQFGGSESNAILVDATGSGCDDAAVSVFYGMFQQAVIQHDAEELAHAEEDEDYTPTLWQDVYADIDEEEISASLDREMWVSSESVSTNKFRVVAYMAYTTNGSVVMPAGVNSTYVYKIPICYSEVFDSESGSEPSPKYLNQIYAMYSEETVGADTNGVDIRFWDPAGMLKVNLYAVKQATETITDFEDAVESGVLSQYYSGGDKIRISCKDPVTSVSTPPVSTTIYGSLTVEGDILSETSRITYDSTDISLVAKGEEIRVVTVTIEVLDSDTGERVLEPETVTRLQ